MSTMYALPNGGTIEFAALTAGEATLLLHVRTTLRQARRILRRNTKALEIFREKDRHRPMTLNLGCPHCRYDDDEEELQCYDCRWRQAAHHLTTEHRSLTACEEYVNDIAAACMRFSFGGVRGGQQEGIELCSDQVIVRPWCRFSADEREDTELFLQGHIDWANLVLALGGVRAPEDLPKDRPWRN